MKRPGWLLLLQRADAGRSSWLAFLGAFWPFLLGALLVAGGLAAIVLGYLGVAGTVHVGLQLPYLASGTLLGLALVVFGSALLVLHTVGRQTRLLRRLLEERGLPAAPSPSAPLSQDGVVLVARGAARFHRPGCLLVEGREARRLKPATAVCQGLQPCGVCDPPA